jgi:hypothetical protein
MKDAAKGSALDIFHPNARRMLLGDPGPAEPLAHRYLLARCARLDRYA